ncbi:fibrous sheath-interacting protein 1 [Lampris incognitus]|uniref:fibrous sheath-interacting protein 1 n=1 Tax=Lampris incognitus TaxID=2546036 RepID=UPI0024B48D48|nr:fibrous sheath-interacting protein 1 [Lampris incognitus]
MKMTDSIFRPASGERTCTSSLSSVSLSSNPDADTVKDQGIPEETAIRLSSGSPDGTVVDKENEESDIQMAIDEMKRLDIILAAKICEEKQVKCQGKALKQKICQDLLQIKPESLSVCAYEAENTRLFLALEATCGDKRLGNMQESSDVRQDNGQEQSEGSHCGAPRDSKRKQEDFVKKNIELASAAGGHALMTQAEKERLAELLNEMEEEEEDSATGADREDNLWTLSAPMGQGYTPESSSLKRLADIESSLHPLLSFKESFSVRSFFINCCWSQGHSSEGGWEFDEDLQPAERVLQDVRERREQEKCLQEIQQQLEIQETISESPKLEEEQLLGLLEECELEQSWRQGQGAEDIAPRDPDRDTDRLLNFAPPLPEDLLSELLTDAYTTSVSSLENWSHEE